MTCMSSSQHTPTGTRRTFTHRPPSQGQARQTRTNLFGPPFFWSCFNSRAESSRCAPPLSAWLCGAAELVVTRAAAREGSGGEKFSNMYPYLLLPSLRGAVPLAKKRSFQQKRHLFDLFPLGRRSVRPHSKNCCFFNVAFIFFKGGPPAPPSPFCKNHRLSLSLFVAPAEHSSCSAGKASGISLLCVCVGYYCLAASV